MLVLLQSTRWFYMGEGHEQIEAVKLLIIFQIL